MKDSGAFPASTNIYPYEEIAVPGICGIISNKSVHDNELDLNQMLQCMNHESFYTSGKYVHQELGLYVGWTCHENSFCDCMPMFNENKDLALFFAGEDFSDEKLINELKAKGHEFDTSTNASYMIHYYEQMKETFFSKLNGFFHGLIADIRCNKIVLFNDRYGMRRLYYYIGEDEFLFSSEAKSLLRIHPELKQVDPSSLGEFFSYGCVLNHRTLFKNIFMLPGGSVWTFDGNKQLAKGRYFTPETWESQLIMGEDEFYPALKEKFREIVPRYLRSNGRVGLSLTGGLDTRMILASADIQPGKLPCFTFGGMFRESFDVQVSREVAAACRQPHNVVRLDREFITEFPRLAEKTVYLSDGAQDVTAAPNIYVNRLARMVADIRMTGNYGQEVLRRYVAFRPNPPSRYLFDPDFLPYIQEAERTYADALDGNRLSFSLFKQAPWYQYGRFVVEDSQMVQRSPFMDNELVELVYRAPAAALKTEIITLRVISESSPKLSRILTDRGTLGRLPSPVSFLIQQYRELLSKAEYCCNNGMPEWATALERILRPLKLESLFLGRNKYYHLRPWFRDELANYLKQVLLDPGSLSRDFINGAQLEKMVISHIQGKKSYTGLIVSCLSVELMHRLLLEGGH